MKANELRIGNWFKGDNLDELNHQIIAKDIVELDDDPQDDYYKPITLTEEWLVKFGFERKDNSCDGAAICKNGVYLGLMGLKNDKYCFNAESSTNKSIYVTYVHQLQNLYFALTGEELTIK